jgi:hypothetical protein
MRAFPFLLALALLAGSSATTLADTVQLTNGDLVSGKVLSLDETKLKLKSEALGEVTIARDKIASIHLGDARPVAIPPKPVLPNDPLPPIPNVDDVLKQLQKGGANPDVLKQLQDKVPALAIPQVQDAFQQRLNGLMTGKMSMDDLRKEAADARDQLKKLKADLGPEGDALDGYLNILESFLQKTAPSKPAKP